MRMESGIGSGTSRPSYLSGAREGNHRLTTRDIWNMDVIDGSGFSDRS